jgi:hypothetical protein
MGEALRERSSEQPLHHAMLRVQLNNGVADILLGREDNLTDRRSSAPLEVTAAIVRRLSQRVQN